MHLQSERKNPNTVFIFIFYFITFILYIYFIAFWRGPVPFVHPRKYAPASDYHVFRSKAHFLRGRNLENFEAVEVGLAEFLASDARDLYRRGIINLAEKWLKTIQFYGLNFEE